MKIILATQNKHKIEEIQVYFKELPGVILSEAKDPVELKEEGSTLRDNALQIA